jgi:hydroxymethylbilane synthase
MIRIGTRGSDLALWQARYIAGLIGGDRARIVIIKTKGDRVRNVAFDKMEGKGFFTKEIEEALLDGRVDLAVHSLKDLPTDETEGLTIAAVSRRGSPADVLLIRSGSVARENPLPLREGASVGTSSLRRAAQIRHIMPSLSLTPLRGNVPTRVRRLRDGRYDAIILAQAGIDRLELDLGGLELFTLPYDVFLPAPAQGALALQIRRGDRDLETYLKSFNHRETELAVTAERQFLRSFGGGCHVPIGALGRIAGGNIELSGVVASADGGRLIRKTLTGPDPRVLGAALAAALKQEGADALL